VRASALITIAEVQGEPSALASVWQSVRLHAGFEQREARIPEMRKGLLPPRSWPTSAVRAAKASVCASHERLVFHTPHAPLTDHPPRNERTSLIASRRSVLDRSPGLRGIIEGAHTMQSNPLTTSCREDRSQKVRFVDHPTCCAFERSRLHRRLISMRVVPIFPSLTHAALAAMLTASKIRSAASLLLGSRTGLDHVHGASTKYELAIRSAGVAHPPLQ